MNPGPGPTPDSLWEKISPPEGEISTFFLTDEPANDILSREALWEVPRRPMKKDRVFAEHLGTHVDGSASIYVEGFREVRADKACCRWFYTLRLERRRVNLTTELARLWVDASLPTPAEFWMGIVPINGPVPTLPAYAAILATRPAVVQVQEEARGFYRDLAFAASAEAFHGGIAEAVACVAMINGGIK